MSSELSFTGYSFSPSSFTYTTGYENTAVGTSALLTGTTTSFGSPALTTTPFTFGASGITIAPPISTYPLIMPWPEWATPVAGAIEFDHVTGKIKVFDGKDWVEIKNRTDEITVTEDESLVPVEVLDKIAKEIYG